MITCEDWREAPAETVHPLFEAECRRWYDSLGWDYRPSCQLLENARSGRRLPGFIARDEAGAIVGWTYYLLHDATLHIGNLVASRGPVVGALLDAIGRTPETRHARRQSCFLYPQSRTIETALVRRRFAIERHEYMERRPTSDHAPRTPDRKYVLRPWSGRPMSDLVRLFAGAYAGMPQARCFAPDGRLEQWTTYVAQLIQTPACGRFEQGLSLVAETPAGELAGAVLVTALAERTAHIAQMAVAAPHRGRGLGAWLVESVCERAGAARYERITLIVATSNETAGRLYARLGFAGGAAFVFADKIVSTG